MDYCRWQMATGKAEKVTHLQPSLQEWRVDDLGSGAQTMHQGTASIPGSKARWAYDMFARRVQMQTASEVLAMSMRLQKVTISCLIRDLEAKSV